MHRQRRTSGAKAPFSPGFYGMAEAMPFRKINAAVVSFSYPERHGAGFGVQHFVERDHYFSGKLYIHDPVLIERLFSEDARWLRNLTRSITRSPTLR